MIKLPSGIDINNLIDDIRIYSWEAADILLYYSKLLENSDDKTKILKNNNEDDPVTLADLKVNETLIKRINEKYRNINWDILSEENVKASSEYVESNNDWMWVLDPLDGTKDFIQKTGNYAMHLALNFKQKPYIGFVLIPNKDQLWIPNGFAHGFLTISDYADVAYKTDQYWMPKYELSLRWDDPKISINWPNLDLEPFLSKKDKNGLFLDKIDKSKLF